MRGTGTKAQTEWNSSFRREEGARERVVTWPRVTPGEDRGGRVTGVSAEGRCSPGHPEPAEWEQEDD